jgi:hypothetical protein
LLPRRGHVEDGTLARVSELFERIEMRIAVALIVGLVIGAEREQRLAESKTVHRSAGIRTFTIVALLGAVGMALEQPMTLAVLGAGVVAAALVAYALGDRTDPGLTSEAALILTFGLGALAISEPQLALRGGHRHRAPPRVPSADPRRGQRGVEPRGAPRRVARCGRGARRAAAHARPHGRFRSVS